jgi:hypothetical protein
VTGTVLTRLRTLLLVTGCLGSAACGTELGPTSPRVLVRVLPASEPARRTTAVVQGDVLVVKGRYALRAGCRTLSGEIEEKPGALKLSIVGHLPARPCDDSSSAMDYEARIGPLAPGSFQLTVVAVVAERRRWVVPIALRQDIRIE